MTTNPTRSVYLPSPDRMRITTDHVAYDYDLEVWTVSGTHRVVEMHRTDEQVTYHVTVPVHRPRQDSWSCDCPTAKHKGGQCKHVLALKAGLRSIGVKV